MTEEEIKGLEADIEWDELYLDLIDVDYGSRMLHINFGCDKQWNEKLLEGIAAKPALAFQH